MDSRRPPESGPSSSPLSATRNERRPVSSPGVGTVPSAPLAVRITGAQVQAPSPAAAATSPIQSIRPMDNRTAITDPRMDQIDRRIHDNDWRGIVTDNGPISDASTFPPNIALIVALAHHESNDEGSHEAVLLSVKCMATLLGVPENSAIAGVIGRRLMRKNPVLLRDRKAPPARVSVLIVVLTLGLGALTGWLLSGGWGLVVATIRAFFHRGD